MTTYPKSLARKSKLFKDFSDEELTELPGMLVHRHYKKGEIILEEGKVDEDVYLIKSGVVEVVKFTGKTHQVVNEIGGDTFFGEQAFLDGSPRSATIRAQVDTELFVLSKQAVMDHPENESLLNKLYLNIALVTSSRLKHSVSGYAATMEKEISLLKEKAYFDKFFVIIFITYSIAQVITSLIHNIFEDINVFSLTFGWIYLALLVMPFIYFVCRGEEPWRNFGVTLINWKKSLIEGALFSLVLIGIVSIGLFIAGQMGRVDLKLVTLHGITKYWGLESFLYFFHSYGQEFVIHGVFQTAFQRFLNDERGLRSVMLTAWLFGLSHILYGPFLILGSLVVGFFFGLIYLRHKNLLGVTIVHFMLGVVAISVGALFGEIQL